MPGVREIWANRVDQGLRIELFRVARLPAEAVREAIHRADEQAWEVIASDDRPNETSGFCALIEFGEVQS